MRLDLLPESWQAVLSDEFSQPYFKKLVEFVDDERAKQTIYPSEEDVFNAFRLTPYESVNALLLGQDPYHGAGQAHGLCFSVRPGVATPPSLVNMYKELENDLGVKRPNHGYLVKWAQQGLLMLNAVMTVRAGQANSHKSKGWEHFTDAAIKAVNAKESPVVFVLWGGYAQKKRKLIDTTRHTVIESAHPSPLSASNGFFGGRPYSKINAALQAHGHPPIDWKLDDL